MVGVLVGSVGIKRDYDLRLQAANGVHEERTNLIGRRRRELSIFVVKRVYIVVSDTKASRGFALSASLRRGSSSIEQRSAVDPRSPRVAQTTPTRTPQFMYLAIVPAAKKLSSSGWARISRIEGILSTPIVWKDKLDDVENGILCGYECDSLGRAA